MPKFIYSARNQTGERVNGSEDVDTADELVTRLQLRGLIVTNIRVQSSSAERRRPSGKAKRRKFSHGGIKEDDLNLFSRQLATALDSGVPLLKSLDAIARQISSKKFYDVITKVMHDVESGFSLRDALAKYPKVFSNLWVNLIETGEASGNLPVILDRLATYLERRASFRSKVVSAMVYPSILMTVAVGAVFVFVMVVVPKFTEIFGNFEIELPLPTKILIAASYLLRKNFILLLMAGGGIIFGFRKFSQTKFGKEQIDKVLFKLPLINEYLRLAETEKFTSAMATLLESGVPILYALEISENSAESGSVQRIIKMVKENVRDGRTLAAPLEESGFFPPMVSQMLSMGEEIGELDKMFKKISVYYAEILETQITRFAAMFEPMMIVFMGATIGAMVISMFLPIFKLATLTQ